MYIWWHIRCREGFDSIESDIKGVGFDSHGARSEFVHGLIRRIRRINRSLLLRRF